jgi:O-antigen/teichoic acid export membrane protein
VSSSNEHTPRNESSIRRTLFGGLTITVAANVLLYLGHLIIARRLSREDYAIFTVVVSFVSLMALFADLGLTLLFVRKFAEADAERKRGERERRGELLGSMLVLRIGLSVVVSVVVVLITPFLGYSLEVTKLIYIMLLTLFISSRLMVVRSVGEAFLRGHNRYHLIALFAAIDAAAFVLALYFYGGGSLDLEGAVLIYSLCHIPGFLLLSWFIASHAKETGFRLSFHFGSLKKMVIEGMPLIFSTAFLTIHNYADALLLDKLSTPLQVSAYGAGLRILSAIVFLPTVFSAVIGPRVTHAITRNDPNEIQGVVDKGIRLLIVSALVIALALTTAPTTIISILFGGDKYGDVRSLVMVFGWSFVPIAFAAFLTEIAIAEGKLWISAIYTGVIMIASISTDLLLIPTYGALGAAIAKCVAVSIGAIVLGTVVKRLAVLQTRQFMVFVGRSATAIIIALAMYILVHRQLLLPEIPSVLLVVISFSLVILITKAVAPREILSIVSSKGNSRGDQ